MQFAGASGYGAVQVVALDIGNGVAVEVDVVQMAAAVIQVVECFARGQEGFGAVAEDIITYYSVMKVIITLQI
ncbi:hypothetical protein [Neisseria canis]|uniref:hypothetical protein n=1 Tax=Neisseria canis TaxID=493 RepID=UPI001E33CDC1|nr:hypothetical protein [Neisseria canis]